MTTEIIIGDQVGQTPTIYVVPRCKDGSTIDDLIYSFIKAKFARTQSKKTAETYLATINGFRKCLVAPGMDLVMYPSAEAPDYDTIRVRIAEQAHDFAVLSMRPGRATVSNNTRNLRLATLSSFYDYAGRNMKIPFANPIEIVDRSPAEAYAGAVALESEDVRSCLANIDTGTPAGKRDYALLQLLLNTGRRVSDIQRLIWADLRVSKAGMVSVSFKHMKGGKSVTKQLDERVSALLLSYLHSYYGADLGTLPLDAPIWVNMSEISNGKCKPGVALGYQAIRKICQKYLGVSKVHTTRHTFTLLMQEAGATTEELQEELMHSNIAVTQVYARHLKRAKNKHAAIVASMLGL